MKQILALLGALLAFLCGQISAAVFPENPGVVDVRQHYGAKGDGVSDDTAAFQQAAQDNARRLFIPRGTSLLRDKDSPLAAFRHGSYGVKIPLYISP